MRRTDIPELLDSDCGTPAEIAGSLSDLRLVNRWFGGASTMRDLVRTVARRSGARKLSFLDVGGASGDIAEWVSKQLAHDGVRIDFMVLDRRRSHLNGRRNAVAADAFAMPFPDNSFDLVGSSLFAHHLNPDQLPVFLNESLRVCRLAALVNDLHRSRAHLGLVYAGFLFYRSRLTRHDAPASVRRAYTADELCQTLRETRAAAIEWSSHYLCRIGAIAWKDGHFAKATS